MLGKGTSPQDPSRSACHPQARGVRAGQDEALSPLAPLLAQLGARWPWLGAVTLQPVMAAQEEGDDELAAHGGAAGLPGPLWHRAPLAHITQPALGSLSLELGWQPRCCSVMPGRGHRRHKMVPVVLAERFCRAGAVLGMTEGDVPRPSCWAEWRWGCFLIPCQGHSCVMGTFRARGERRGAAGPPLTSVGSRHPHSSHLFTGDPVKKRLSSGHKQCPVITLSFRN